MAMLVFVRGTFDVVVAPGRRRVGAGCFDEGRVLHIAEGDGESRADRRADRSRVSREKVETIEGTHVMTNRVVDETFDGLRIRRRFVDRMIVKIGEDGLDEGLIVGRAIVRDVVDRVTLTIAYFEIAQSRTRHIRAQ